MNRTAVISCVGLEKFYQEGPGIVSVLKNINFSVSAGKMVAIVGNSGCGKTTFLNLLGGLDLPSAGSVKINDIVISSANERTRGKIRNSYLGFVYQFHHLLPEFTALENVAMPLLIRKGSPVEAADAATAILNEIGLAKRLTHKPAELSGGERQRVAIARALVTKPACVLMDEPTGNLDRNTAHTIQSLIRSLNQQLQTSFIIVTHDIDFAKNLDEVHRLEDGHLVQIK